MWARPAGGGGCERRLAAGLCVVQGEGEGAERDRQVRMASGEGRTRSPIDDAHSSATGPRVLKIAQYEAQ